MARALSAANVCKAISIVSALYLGSGLVNMFFARMPVPRIVALVYVACSVAGLLAVAAAFMWSPETFRALALWSMGPVVPIFGTESWQVGFLGLLNLPISLYAGSDHGRVFAGVNLVPGVLFVLLAVYSTRLVKAPGPAGQRELPPGESS
ncbi:MAG: hypothetical protein WBF17_20700 [Phycisphaerae bacterium]